jgi:hypothetical protein
MQEPTTVAGVVARLRQIDEELPAGDGVAVFNRAYLEVTEHIGGLLDGLAGPSPFTDSDMLAELDVRFAALWLHAYDAERSGHPVPAAWRPLFEARAGGRLPVQYALAGMNAHIEHDLPLAVVRTCRSRNVTPDDIHRDYDAVNDVLASVESRIRRSFLTEVGQQIDDRIGAAVHLVSAWNIEKARDLSWVTTETIWALRSTRLLLGRVLSALGHTVGMGSRTLLTPVLHPLAGGAAQ